ncbi:MAG: hypothetical protein Q8L79_16995 [Methylobacter sp.]|uniref:hypothetical protein n=1 Tax=Methylobacter sp. TaxID=2051955 RepID=UPI00272EF1F4|nr:hypothetical protein [Methylobacter sp.]MDP1666808.1 hypothetical protein [Methylobacter sp.]
MDKVRIKVVTIGHLPLHLNLKGVTGWYSEVFQLAGGIENFALRCDADSDGWVFSDSLLKAQLSKNFDADFLIAIVNVPIEDNWYSRRLGDNQIVFTFSQIKDFLTWENIPLENAILRVLYAYTLLYRRSGNKIPGFGEARSFTHDETRGCLFDMNGVKSDLVESCDTPLVCSECEERLRNEHVSTQTIKSTQQEIKKIRKPLYFRALDFVKAHSITALVMSSVFALALGVTGSLIASFVYDGIKAQPREDITSGVAP